MKVNRTLENREILQKGTTKKLLVKTEDFPFFFYTSALLIMKNVLTSLAKRFLLTLRLIASSSTTDAAIQSKLFASGTTLTISKKEIDDITKIVKSLKMDLDLMVCIK